MRNDKKNSNTPAKKSNGHVGEFSPNELEKAELLDMCEDFKAIAEMDLMRFQDQLSYMFRNTLDDLPYVVKNCFTAYDVANKAFLATALHKDTARRMGQKLSNDLDNH